MEISASPNKIYRLMDEKFLIDFFNKRILPHYPEFKSIKKIQVNPIKNFIWHTTYHVVIEYDVTFRDKNGSHTRLPIFCTAHSNDPRKNVNNVLKFLWKNDFSKGYLTIPHPLFYSNYYKAAFYRGIRGNNLLYYIKSREFSEIEYIVEKTAAWLAKLHKIDAKKAENFNEKYNRIETAIPGKKKVIEKIRREYPERLKDYKTIYDILDKREKNFLAITAKRWVIHGDAHPENVIKMGRKKIAMIDFTDSCLSDLARDLGSFLQQLEYMCARRLENPEFTEKIKDIFLSSYLKHSRLKICSGLIERINTYYNWTAFRTAMFFLMKQNPDLKRADELIAEIKNNLNIIN
jgi:thiamine kinase-like enzyme